jgi:hypothetical protein
MEEIEMSNFEKRDLRNHWRRAIKAHDARGRELAVLREKNPHAIDHHTLSDHYRTGDALPAGCGGRRSRLADMGTAPNGRQFGRAKRQGRTPGKEARRDEKEETTRAQSEA